MARGNAVWGIDIGQCALKALRCSLESDGKTVRAEAFDYIEYPKILTQPDADPEALIRDALKEFLSRNNVRGDKVAISVSGQSGLARFIKLPPVEKKKIPDIVKYEAKQQIPFDLEDVIWSYQPMPGTEQGDSLETEVGLFAMKREHVFRAIRPLEDAGVELDIIQLTPICIYNAVTYGVLTDVPPPDEYDPDNPPDWVVILSMGTETTDLVITNGYRIWNRSVPLGGNHFTKQLTKEMKLTFAKAEQLKRNSRDAENAKEIFQAMRSVFNDLVTEVQRSIGFFRTLERKANVTRIVALGNTIKLPGLQQYLAKNLSLPVDRINAYEHFVGSEVTTAPAFEDNVPSFAVCYGLVLQGLGLGKLSTNLVPHELVVARTIRRKKPWALATVAATLGALAFNYAFHYGRFSETNKDLYKAPSGQLESVKGKSASYKSKDEEQKKTLELLKTLGHEVVDMAEGRVLMLELLKVVNDALPREEAADPMTVSVIPIQANRRPQIHVEHWEMKYYTDLGEWYTEDAKKRYQEGLKVTADVQDGSRAVPATEAEAPSTEAPSEDGNATTVPGAVATTESPPSTGVNAPQAAVATTDSDAASPDNVTPAAADAVAAAAAEPAEADLAPGDGIAGGGGPAGEASDDTGVDLAGQAGWVVEIECVHYFNDVNSSPVYGEQYVRNTLIHRLRPDRKVMLPVPGDPENPVQEFTLEQVGICNPLIATKNPVSADPLANPNWTPPMMDEELMDEAQPNRFGMRPKPKTETQQKPKDDKENPKEFKPLAYKFSLQFAWIPRRFSDRDKPLGQPSTTDTAMSP